MSEPIPLRARRADIQELVTQIKALVYENTGTMSVAEAVGVLEMVKHEIIVEQS